MHSLTSQVKQLNGQVTPAVALQQQQCGDSSIRVLPIDRRGTMYNTLHSWRVCLPAAMAADKLAAAWLVRSIWKPTQCYAVAVRSDGNHTALPKVP